MPVQLLNPETNFKSVKDKRQRPYPLQHHPSLALFLSLPLDDL